MKNRQKWQGIAITLGGSLFAVVIALGLCAILLALIGHNPFTVYKQMLDYGTSSDSLLDIVQRAVPLMLSAVAVAIGFKMNLFNIGVEGQTRLAVLLTAAIGAQVNLPAVLHVMFCLVLAMVVGAAWAGVAGVLKVKRGVNEVISTIMLNYIAIGLVSWMFDTWFVVGADTLNVKTKELPRTAWFPGIGRREAHRIPGDRPAGRRRVLGAGVEDEVRLPPAGVGRQRRRSPRRRRQPGKDGDDLDAALRRRRRSGRHARPAR